MRKKETLNEAWVLEELRRVAAASPADYVRLAQENGMQTVELIPLEQLPEERRSALCQIKSGKAGVEVKLCDKMKALELLGKHMGLFAQKPEEEAVQLVDDV